MTEVFRRDYRAAIEYYGSKYAGEQSEAYAVSVQEAIEDLVIGMRLLANNEKSVDYAKGDVAEAWHKGSFRVDAARRSLDLSATTPRDQSPHDVTVCGSTVEHAQLKYYGNARETTTAISAPNYSELDQKVVPADQLEDVRRHSERLAEYHSANRPELAKAYRHTAETVSDSVSLDGSNSLPLEEADSKILVEQLRADGEIDRTSFGVTLEEIIEWQDILRESTKAGARAALITAALNAAPYLIDIAEKAWKRGELTADDFDQLRHETLTTLLRSGLAASLSAAIVTTARAGLMGVGLKQLSSNSVAAAVSLALTVFTTSIRATRGEISWQVATGKIIEDAIIMASGIGCSMAAQSLIPLPQVAVIFGNIIGTVVARMMIDHTKNTVLGLTVNSGWTIFGLVEQDYKVPSRVLQECGLEVLSPRTFPLRQIDLKLIELRAFRPSQIGITFLRRGVVCFGRVGYLSDANVILTRSHSSNKE